MDEENEKKKLEQISEEPSVELIDELPNDIPEQEIIESAPAVGSVPVIESTAPPTPPTPPKRSKKGPIITIICILLAIIAAVMVARHVHLCAVVLDVPYPARPPILILAVGPQVLIRAG